MVEQGCNEKIFMAKSMYYEGFSHPIRSCSPSSVLECNSSMAFPDVSPVGLMSFDLGSDPCSSLYPVSGPNLENMVKKEPGDCHHGEEQEELLGNVSKQEVEDQHEIETVQPEETNKLSESSVKRESAEDSTGEDCDAKAQCSKRRKSVQKRIVCVPVGPADGRQKSDGPPSDMWAWRKYGQKPIKGSPYPRGYYRCSSSKGCCARKQVERSCTDPSMLIITYTSDHNHPWPANRNNNSNSNSAAKHSQEVPTVSAAPAAAAPTVSEKSSTDQHVGASSEDQPCISSSDNLFSLIINSPDRLEQLQAAEPLSTFMQDVELCISRSNHSLDHEDDDLYADLGELPESSTIFSTSRGFFEDDENKNNGGIDRCSWLSWSGNCLNNAVI
ncbi:hypothetical protein SUGI_0503880 [Cryptomeria japonica]|uniref:probable WRKY transcription factor 14 n=1 Tax=Cryptomeria japonica TaxID=3369 RepID=UPI002408C3E3|nr:probable WRKY transcription factor 14 [Cryptomeria japonica]GLJ26229.1 hypothetical protein SUGI_0503880 [Cryptomeria japonica]